MFLREGIHLTWFDVFPPGDCFDHFEEQDRRAEVCRGGDKAADGFLLLGSRLMGESLTGDESQADGEVFGIKIKKRSRWERSYQGRRCRWRRGMLGGWRDVEGLSSELWSLNGNLGGSEQWKGLRRWLEGRRPMVVVAVRLKVLARERAIGGRTGSEGVKKPSNLP